MIKYILIAVIVLLLAFCGIVYLGTPNYGSEIPAPPGMREAIVSHFAEREKRGVDTVKVYYCSKPFSLQPEYVADVSLVKVRIDTKNIEEFVKEDYTRNEIFRSWRLRGKIGNNSEWLFISVPLRTSKPKEAESPCSFFDPASFDNRIANAVAPSPNK